MVHFRTKKQIVRVWEQARGGTSSGQTTLFHRSGLFERQEESLEYGNKQGKGRALDGRLFSVGGAFLNEKNNHQIMVVS